MQTSKVIHFEIDPAEIDKNVKTDVAVLGDSKVSFRCYFTIINENPHKIGIKNLKTYMLLNMKK